MGSNAERLLDAPDFHVDEVVENRVRLIRLSSVQVASVGASTTTDGFKGLEASGMMAGMKHEAMWLTFALVHGLDDNARASLIAEMITKHMRRFEWYDAKERRKQDYRKRLVAVVTCAVNRLAGKPMTAKRSAEFIGLSRNSYYKTWFERESQIYSLFCSWYFEAEKAFKNGPCA